MRTCYTSFGDKAARWATLIGLGIVAQAKAAGPLVAPGAGLPDRGARLRVLHEWARRGRYVAEDGPCDHLQPVAVTLERGGDCEDWAAVILAALLQAAIPARVVAGGDALDAFRHVWVEGFAGGRWWPLDAKGTQQGQPFGVVTPWAAVTVIWTDGLEGSGSDPMIRSADDAARYLSPEQVRLYLSKVEAQQGAAAKLAVVQALRGGYHNRTRDQVLAYIGQAISAAAAIISAKTGASVAGAEAYSELLRPRTLEETNEVMVSEWLAKFQAVAPQVLRDFALQLGAAPTVDATKAAAVVHAYLVLQANALGVLFDDWINEYMAGRTASRADVLPGGSGSQLTEFGGRVLRFARNVFVTAPGRIIRDAGNALLKAEASAPWLAQYVTKPLGFHAQAVLLREIGRSMVDGSVSTFDEKALGRATATTFQASGQALLVAAPFLPPPWNVAAAAAGALSIAAGNVMHAEMDRAEARRAESRAGAAPGQSASGGGLPPGWAVLAEGWLYGPVEYDGQVYTIAVEWTGAGWTPRAVWNGTEWLPLSA